MVLNFYDLKIKKNPALTSLFWVWRPFLNSHRVKEAASPTCKGCWTDRTIDICFLEVELHELNLDSLPLYYVKACLLVSFPLESCF